MIVLIRLLDVPETLVTDYQSTPWRKPKILHKLLLNNTLFTLTYGKGHITGESDVRVTVHP